MRGGREGRGGGGRWEEVGERKLRKKRGMWGGEIESGGGGCGNRNGGGRGGEDKEEMEVARRR